MFRYLAYTLTVLIPVAAQMHSLSREQMTKYTSQNPFERFEDGRPKVPDALLKKLEAMSSEEVLGIIRKGYPNQYADGFKILNPGKNLIGRAFTLQLLPTRPDISDVDQKEWREKHGGGRLSHQTALDMLQKGDVFVVDAFGNLNAGGIVGDNLAYYVWKTTGAGFVIDGAIRDLNGIQPFGMGGYYRGAVPAAIREVMVAGINVPVRIGHVTVMPGDVVFGDREGVFFIPPHLLQEIVDEAEITHVHDEWTKRKFDEGKYKSTEIYGRPTDPALIKEYEDYLKPRIEPRLWDEYVKRYRQPAQRKKQ
ncbi:MAG: dimethylmenaquinone methyltransferase [Bryobacteraceae bacterium]